MTAGMSQSVNLGREMLEAVGDFKEALKDTKKELRDLEEDARRIEREGGIVGTGLRGQIEGKRGQRNRLEDSVKQQRVVKAQQRNNRQRGSQLRRAALNPLSVLKEVGVEAALKTDLGRGAVKAFRGGMAKFSEISASKAGFAASGVLGVAAGAHAGASFGLNIVRKERELFLNQSLGNLRIAELAQSTFGAAAAGGGVNRAAGQILSQALDMKANRAETLAEKGVFDALSKAYYGRSAQQNQIGTRVAEQSIRRQARIKQFGAGYGEATSRARVTRARSIQIKDAYLKERGSWVAELATRYVGSNREVVDPTAWLWNTMTIGKVNPGAAAMENAILSQQERSDKAFDELRENELKQFNTSTAFAMRRAMVNERNNAIRAFENDRQMRGVTWRLQ